MSRPVRPASLVIAPTRSLRADAGDAAGADEDPGHVRVGTLARLGRARRAVLAAAAAASGISSSSAATAAGLVGELDRGGGDVHQVVALGERLDDHAEVVEIAVLEQRLLQARAGELQPARAQVGDRRDLLERDPLLGDLLDRLQVAGARAARRA